MRPFSPTFHDDMEKMTVAAILWRTWIERRASAVRVFPAGSDGASFGFTVYRMYT